MGKLNGLLVVVTGVVLWALPVAAQDRPTGPDQTLVAKLHMLAQDEIAMAKMGEARGVRPRVTSFAAKIERDHQVADQRLVGYANRKNMNLDEVANPGDALRHGPLAMAPVATSTREEFDYNFVNKMVADHQAAIDAATAAQRLARDPELKDLIGGSLKVMTDHLVTAQELLAGIPEPPARVVQLPGEPAGISRTQTGADEPPAAAAAVAR
jgi:predicted outer membrane protein